MIQNHMIAIAAAVPSLKVADIRYNTKQIIELCHQNQNAGVLVFPELCITGYTCADLFEHTLLLEEAEKALETIAQETAALKGLLIEVGLPVKVKDQLYNCAAVLNEGVIVGIVPKINIPTYSEFYEDRWFTSGRDVKNQEIIFANQLVPFGVDLLFHDAYSTACVGVEICEDLWVADKPSTHLAIAGANIIVNPSASDEVIGKQEYRKNLVSQQSASCYCAYAYASSGTGESSTDLVFSGHCLIAENGRLLKEMIFAEADSLITSVIDLDTIAYNRMHQNTFVNESEGYRRVSVHVSPIGKENNITADALCTALKEADYDINRFPFVPANEKDRMERCMNILRIQANGLATRVRSTGIHNLVIGISGGLDSTLALLVCHEARKIEPSIRIIAYTMPNHGNTTSRTYNNALSLMHLLDTECREVAIENGVALHLKELGRSQVYEGEHDITYENAQARYRTYILMDAANMENGLVVGTGDLSELALGWCTYNGDHMSMYGVNASIPKTLIQYMCRTYAQHTDNKELSDVLISICDTPISPELTPNSSDQIVQKTEDKIGKYDLNDFFLFYTLRYGFTPEKILAFAMKAYDHLTKEEIKEALIRFLNRFFHQQFKRSCLPDGPKVGSVTLSPRGDWRMPSDASVNLWIESLKQA